MRGTPVRILGAGALTAALALSVTACLGDSGNDKAACSKLQQTIKDVGAKGMTQVSDPNGLAKTYADAAATMRTEAKDAGGDVKKAADKAATALEQIGTQVKNAGSGSGAPSVDTGNLISAGKDLKSACG